MRRSHRLSSLICLLLLGLSACGVLTIDVDVYKGPLANHVDVQTEQTVVLALAAKPLLLKLRYELEASARFAQFADNPPETNPRPFHTGEGPDDAALIYLKHSDEWLRPGNADEFATTADTTTIDFHLIKTDSHYQSTPDPQAPDYGEPPSTLR